MARKIKTGDYVGVLEGSGNCGVEDGEQGFVIDGDNQYALEVIFPSGKDPFWRKDKVLGIGFGWRTSSKEVKLVCRL